MIARLGLVKWALWGLVFAWPSSVITAAEAERRIEYNRDIRPILSENCFYCHGPDKGTRKAGLRLDDRSAAIELKAITPRSVEESELVARILSDDAEEMMPPPKSTKKLSIEQKELLQRWVSEGAEYQAHWAYEPLRGPTPPSPRQINWVRNPIDSFILRDIEARQITPSPTADRRTLIRRLSLDLIGLPPSPEEVAAFLADTHPQAYEHLVDRLLQSPHYGERMAVPWLDLVRFADTVGYHGDQNQNVFPYRDYVVDAFNSNKPFDQFTVEQLAGDLLPNATPEQRTASAFNRLNMVTREGGAQPNEYLAKYTADRVRTVAITWMGSTLGCAECHDHKFDPFTAKDFYQLGAFFADVEQWGVYMDYQYTPNPELRGYSNDHPFPPEQSITSPYLQRRAAALNQKLHEHLAIAAHRVDADPVQVATRADWAVQTAEFLARNPTGWAVPPAAVDSVREIIDGTVVTDDKMVLLRGKLDPKLVVPIRLQPATGWVASIRLELVPHPSNEGRFTRAAARGVPVKLTASLDRAGRADLNQPITFTRSDANAKTTTFTNGHADLNINETWWVATGHLDQTQTAVYILDRPVWVEAGDTVLVNLNASVVGAVQLAVSPFWFPEPSRPIVDPALIGALTASVGDWTSAERSAVAAAFTVGTDLTATDRDQAHRLVLEQAACHAGQARVVVTKARPPRVTRVLPRGNWQDESGEVVEPGLPHFLPQPAEAKSRRLDRLDLAHWLTAPENPLTARVFVNRTWKLFFGTGLAAVMEDVGAQGEWPSHPELLDWLATDFQASGWDIKRLIKQIAMSATYQQDSKLRPELREADPANRWLASQSPRRLDAEFVRDNALSVAGLLNLEMGGPSVFPFQPTGYYAALQFPTREYSTQTDERQYRRGLYSHWQRTFLHPMLANFDAPSREECIANRTAANTPQQALTLLNDPNFVAAARALACFALDPNADQFCSDEARLNGLFERVLARPLRPRETASLLAFLNNQRDLNRLDPASAVRLVQKPLGTTSTFDPIEWAAWTEVCRVILNLHETITRY